MLLISRIIADKPIEILTSSFADRIAVKEATEGGAVVAEPVVDQTRLGIEVFGREAEGVVIGNGGSAHPQGLAEGPVLILGVEASVGAVEQTRKVANAATKSLHSS